MTEKHIVRLAFWMMFIHILDFAIVIPLSPYFIETLHVHVSLIGTVAGIYMYAAGCSSLLFARLLTRVSRKKLLILTLLGLAISTALTGLAWDADSLVIARIIAGLFGGGMASMAGTLVTESVPPERRGKAMGFMMSSITLVMCLGTPISIYSASLIGWRAVFFTVCAMIALLSIIVSQLAIPKLNTQIQHSRVKDLLKKNINWLGFAAVGLSMGTNFFLVPNLANYYVLNRGISLTELSLLYFLSGSLAIVGTYLAGLGADRYSIPRLMLFISVMVFIFLMLGIFYESIPVLVFMCGFMFFASARRTIVSVQTSLIPQHEEKPAFMSAQNAVRNFTAATAATVSGIFLSRNAQGQLTGIDNLVLISIGFGVILLILTLLIQLGLNKRKEEAA
ncbi:MAG: hypothetical protein COV52_06465 [Gammaproteobacteria bacterium CG11_big_fil_rev_8_21_14_0_20_46_22]|nr:MAG: hypothetical protein COW05_07200 [Gammaproteobacteria bacterium CG12_big_fil_rev_8_21_14_0_65_46_12]PIR11142.1 MAG: hypothetical protein COV52_06465 [Gammaproteobacteria bacterium CG11_big_fil_rev_8_21_14_0_20_46_22]